MVLKVQSQGLNCVGHEAILLLDFFPESLTAQGGEVFEIHVSASDLTYLPFLFLLCLYLLSALSAVATAAPPIVLMGVLAAAAPKCAGCY